MAEQRQRAKADAAARKHAHADLTAYRELVDAGPTEFTGFDELTSEATILGIFVDGKRVPVVAHGGTPRQPTASSSSSTARRSTPSPAARSPTSAPSAAPAPARPRRPPSPTCRRSPRRLFVHRVTVESGEFVEGDTVVAAVDPKWRHGATQGHSGTHMVHAALRQVLGPNAVQAGSLNRPGYLRFDFNWQGSLSDEQRERDRGGHQRGRRGRLRGQHASTPSSTRPRRWARWRCSARPIPRRSASSRSAGRSRSSCAVARTCTTPPRSVRSPSSANRRSAPGCAASRPTSASTRSSTWPRSVP